MQKSILIIGAGTGLSLGVALKFGKEGYKVGLISRNNDNLEKLDAQLKAENIDCFYKAADVKNTTELHQAITDLRSILGEIDTLFYNAAHLKMQNILDETPETLTDDFMINVVGAQQAFKILHPDLQKQNGSMLIAGGGLAFYPSPDLGSLAIGKAAIRNLALQLNAIGKEKGIYVGILNITGRIEPESAKHSPEILAEKFWKLNSDRTLEEETY
ncbi:SDR family NAD(P)-dependent oxidoreductase [Pedobacter sp. N23S346]|uniref:SDR family NAD(P)-dependent oxidoreductase n=1 Tax=Pedobacter sp. N23S346 TaxID=3402750 RepID=UPI003AD684C7